MPSNNSRIRIIFIFIFLLTIIHLAFLTDNLSHHKLPTFTLSCPFNSAANGVCQLVFTNKHHNVQLYYFMEEGDDLPHYICICPYLDDKKEQRICMLDRDEVQREIQNSVPFDANYIGRYASKVWKIDLFSPIYSREDYKTEAMLFGNSYYKGYIIWHHPNGRGCSAMPTDSSNEDLLQNTLNILVQNEWNVKATRMHACPLAKDGHFGCVHQHIFIIDDDNIITFNMSEQNFCENCSWMWEKDGITNYEPWLGVEKSDFELERTNIEEPLEFVISPSFEPKLEKITADEMEEYTKRKCSYKKDFLQMEPLRQFAQSMETSKDDKLTNNKVMEATKKKGKIAALAAGGISKFFAAFGKN